MNQPVSDERIQQITSFLKAGREAHAGPEKPRTDFDAKEGLALKDKQSRCRNNWHEYERRKQRLLRMQMEQRRPMPPEEYQRAIQKLAGRLKL